MAYTEISGDRGMKVNTVVDKKAEAIIHTVTGEITYEGIKSSYESARSLPDFQENMNSIWDIRDADASKFDSQDVIKTARYFETQTKNRTEYKTAVIVSRDLEHGVSKIYQVAAADLPAKIRVFNNLEEAKKWITGSD
jgi:hypothetical protein